VQGSSCIVRRVCTGIIQTKKIIQMTLRKKLVTFGCTSVKYGATMTRPLEIIHATGSSTSSAERKIRQHYIFGQGTGKGIIVQFLKDCVLGRVLFVKECRQLPTGRAMIERKSNRYPSGHSRQVLHSKSDRRLFGKVSSLTRRVKAANGSIPVLSTQLNGNLETEHTILSSGHDTEPPGEHPRTHCLYEFGRKFVEQEGSNVGLFASGSRVIERKFTVCGSNN